MRTTNKKTAVEQAEILINAREQMNALKKIEKQAKEFLLGLLNEKQTDTLMCGELLIVRKDVQSTVLDKAALLKKMGPDFVDEFCRLNEYQKLEIKRAG